MMTLIRLRPVNLRLSPAPGIVITDIELIVERAMLAITLLAAFLVVIAALNIVDFGRID